MKWFKSHRFGSSAQFHAKQGLASLKAPPQALARLVVIACALLNSGVSAQESGPSEYQVKAAYLLNFAKYVEWLAAAFAGKNTPVVIGILGEEHFGAGLKKMTEGKTVNGRGFLVKHLHSIEQAREHCQILFVGASEKRWAAHRRI